jgi:hypothetical protein
LIYKKHKNKYNTYTCKDSQGHILKLTDDS